MHVHLCHSNIRAFQSVYFETSILPSVHSDYETSILFLNNIVRFLCALSKPFYIAYIYYIAWLISLKFTVMTPFIPFPYKHVYNLTCIVFILLRLSRAGVCAPVCVWAPGCCNVLSSFVLIEQCFIPSC